MNNRRKLWVFSSAGALLVLGCLVLLNALAAKFHVRADFSDGRLYSLSPGSRRILQGLDVPVEIRVYFSKRLPPEYQARRSYVRDLLTEYEEVSAGKVKARFIDVDKDAETKRRALEQGISPVEFNVVTHERFEVQQGFMGLILQHEEKKEVLPVILRSETLEYDLTSRILRLTRLKRKNVGVLSSHGATAPEGLHPRVREMLERNYELTPVDLRGLTPGATLSADISALIVLGPTETFPDYHLYTLDQFLLSGRPLVLAVDPRKSDMRAFMATELKTGLRGLLKHYGLTLSTQYVLDAQNQKVQISQQRGWITFTNVVDYPLFVVSTDLDRKHPVTRYLNALTFPLVASVEAAATAAHRVVLLAKSSKFSWQSAAWRRGAGHSISPLQQAVRDPKDLPGPFPLATAMTGPFTSYFSSGADAPHPLPKQSDAAAFLPVSPDSARLIVVGTSRFASPDMPVGETGTAFLLNLVDWMALDADLITMRAKGLVFRPLREIPVSKKTAVRWINILGPSLLVLLFGGIRMRIRRGLVRKRVARFTPLPVLDDAAADA